MKFTKPPKNVTPMREQRRKELGLEFSERPEWSIPADFVPSDLKELLNHFAWGNALEIGSLPSDGNLLKKLLQDTAMAEVYSFLAKFKPQGHEWSQILIDCFMKAFQYVESDCEGEEKEQYHQDVEYYSDIANTAFKLLHLINDGPPVNSALSDYLNDMPFRRELLRLLSLSTSAKWPELYLRWYSEQDFRRFDEVHDPKHLKHTHDLKRERFVPSWDDVEKMRIEESPWFYSEDPLKEIYFPPPSMPTPFSSKANINARKFIEKSLAFLDEISNQGGREFVTGESWRTRQPSESSCIFLNTKHWRIICTLLYGGDLKNDKQYGQRTISKILAGHRDNSSYYSSEK